MVIGQTTLRQAIQLSMKELKEKKLDKNVYFVDSFYSLLNQLPVKYYKPSSLL